MRARYYNPYLCRFLNADPAGFSGGLNFYAYADGNPVSLIDPFGLGAGDESFFSWLGNQALGGFQVGLGWGFDQVNDVGLTIGGLGNDVVGNTLNVVGAAFGNPYLGQGFEEWAQNHYDARGSAAQAGWYDAGHPAVQAATLGMLLLNPEAGAARLGAAKTAAQEQYFISSGVRRSLSSLQNGAGDIPATIVRSGQADVQTTLRLDQLFSPKFEVPADSRLLNITPPIRVPIEVQPLGIPGQPGSIPLNQVRIVPPGGG
jgi:hypothetical protein